jgi:hypothetical protein
MSKKKKKKRRRRRRKKERKKDQLSHNLTQLHQDINDSQGK